MKLYQVVPLVLLFTLFAGCSSPKDPQVVVKESQTLLGSGKYEEAIQMLEESYKSNPSLDSLRPALANAHLQYANFLMYKSDLPPRQKYRKALSEYRRVLAIEPGNAEAKQSKDLIESIYKQMGMPVPAETES